MKKSVNNKGSYIGKCITGELIKTELNTKKMIKMIKIHVDGYNDNNIFVGLNFRFWQFQSFIASSIQTATAFS